MFFFVVLFKVEASVPTPEIEKLNGQARAPELNSHACFQFEKLFRGIKNVITVLVK